MALEHLIKVRSRPKLTNFAGQFDFYEGFDQVKQRASLQENLDKPNEKSNTLRRVEVTSRAVRAYLEAEVHGQDSGNR